MSHFLLLYWNAPEPDLAAKTCCIIYYLSGESWYFWPQVITPLLPSNMYQRQARAQMCQYPKGRVNWGEHNPFCHVPKSVLLCVHMAWKQRAARLRRSDHANTSAASSHAPAGPIKHVSIPLKAKFLHVCWQISSAASNKHKAHMEGVGVEKNHRYAAFADHLKCL